MTPCVASSLFRYECHVSTLTGSIWTMTPERSGSHTIPTLESRTKRGFRVVANLMGNLSDSEVILCDKQRGCQIQSQTGQICERRLTHKPFELRREFRS